MGLETRYLTNSNVQDLQAKFGRRNGAWPKKKSGAVHLLALLDGANLFAEKHGTERARAKEQFYQDVCRHFIREKGGRLAEELASAPSRVRWWQGKASGKLLEPRGVAARETVWWFRDAALAVFEGRDAIHRSLGAALAIHHFLSLWNEEHELRWEDQVHSRVGVSARSWEVTLNLAQQAARKQTVLHDTDWERLGQRELALVRGVGGIRRGIHVDTWSIDVKGVDVPSTVPVVDLQLIDRINKLRTLSQNLAEVPSSQVG